MIWNRLPQTWYEAPFMGNGSMGTYICKEPEKNAIRVDVNNSMVHDHREDDKGIYGRSRLLIGYFLLHPVGEITPEPCGSTYGMPKPGDASAPHRGK